MVFSSRIAVLFISVTAISLLIGCTENRNITLLQQNNLLGPISPHNIPPLINKTSMDGKTIEIVHLYSLNPDCSLRESPIIKVLEKPTHGQAVVTQINDFPTYPPNHPNFACDKIKVPITGLSYTPTPGYTGPDSLSFEGFYASGKDTNEIKVQVTVK